ncbi:tyrosinase family protein [Brasilonema bromeliae]|uniref:Tyrosinase family protein n=1 Tax=Brasilonema bromeliae SPC951 TaxID=385972 RepID=A0ABX1P9S6_9CYAN|nr:tyrosinase family protein [Brasilonema bromeliae]NMG20557.1 tyrosinase family protein [Brasilonema bromeliae SPC951]
MMKIHKTIKAVIIASIVAVLVVFGTPALSHNVEHREHKQTLNKVLSDSSDTKLNAAYHNNAINSINSSNSDLAPPNRKFLISTKKTYGIRKNVVDLTQEEKQAFVDAVRTLKHVVPEGSSISIYDQFVAVHVAAMGLMYDSAQGPAAGHDGAHESDLFLPWHREFIHRFEKALQSVNPNVTLPYWDWTDANALAVLFQDDFMGPNGQGVNLSIPGLGEVQGGPVVSGPFTKANGWVLNPNLHIKPSGEPFGDTLLRFLQVPPTNSYPIPKEDVEQILAINDYETFRLALEGFIKLDSSSQQPTPGVFEHNYFHSFVGGATFDPAVGRPEALGTMADLSSAINDPVFWLVHANVDRLWAEWQENGHKGSNYYPATGRHYGENLNDRLWPWDGGESIPANWTPGDLFSLLPSFSPDDIVTPADTLNFRKYAYTYDTLKRAIVNLKSSS